MSFRSLRLSPQERWTVVSLALLVVLPFVVYSNGYHHAYHLDDAYTIVSNTNVRSLRAIPSYFVDPGTLTTNREQADYRPLLQATYAIDYRLGGYDMWWWHCTQILLHALVTLGVYALGRRVLAMTAVSHAREIAFAAAR